MEVAAAAVPRHKPKVEDNINDIIEKTNKETLMGMLGQIKGKGAMRTFFVNGEHRDQGRSETSLFGGWTARQGTYLARSRIPA